MDEFVFIICDVVTGVPLLEIRWFFMDEELTLLRNKTIIAIKVTNDTIGLYTCIVINKLGNDAASSYVDLLS